jgi:glutathione S-transferase
MSLTLVIGSKRWSSWSLRPWLALRQAGIPFAERVIALRQEDTKSRILEYSPSGKVPLLIDGDVPVWDSIAILEYLAERFPEAGFWPAELAARARARSISAEMHSGFPALRRELPIDVSQDAPGFLAAPQLSAEAVDDIARIQAIWRDSRLAFGDGGPFLFGRFSNAEAMYAPVASRFRTYGVEADPVSRSYIETVSALPAMVEWRRAASIEGI